MNHSTTSAVAPRRGRPRKFSGPSRPVTLTLPVETIEALTALDSDLSRAVVRIAQPDVRRRHAAAELATFGRRAVIIVNASRALERRVGVDLVPLPDGRALISFEETTTPDALELRIEDALEDPGLSRADRDTFEAILEILKTARRSGEVALLRRNIIILEGRKRPRSGGRPSRLPHNSPKTKHQRSTE
jgi:CRP-like cAMP-binding protein